MVAMEMGDANECERLQALTIDIDLGLGVLATVEQDSESVDVDHLSTTVAGNSGQGGPRTEYGGVEVQCECVIALM